MMLDIRIWKKNGCTAQLGTIQKWEKHLALQSSKSGEDAHLPGLWDIVRTNTGQRIQASQQLGHLAAVQGHCGTLCQDSQDVPQQYRHEADGTAQRYGLVRVTSRRNIFPSFTSAQFSTNCKQRISTPSASLFYDVMKFFSSACKTAINRLRYRYTDAVMKSAFMTKELKTGFS